MTQVEKHERTPTTDIRRAKEDVLVIGAGPAGIASAYFLQKAGIHYKVVDRANVIASTWASLYPSLTLNTSRWFSHMPEAPFPRHFGIYPTAEQYHSYLLDYVQKHNFNIHLNVDVSEVAPDGEMWRVVMDGETWHYPVVISATGIFGNPTMPTIEGMNDFEGELSHAHDYKHPDQVRDKRVLVVGNGPSGVDIAVASGEVASYTAIAMRTGITLKRRYPLGLPQHGWLMLTERLPKPICKRIMSFLGRMGYPEQERIGLWRPRKGEGGMTAYQGRELLDAVAQGNVKPLHAPIRFEGNTVHFSDGIDEKFDVVIMATGYTPVFPQYLRIDYPYNPEGWRAQSICDWQIGPNGVRGWLLRDTSEHPNGRQVLGYQGLYQVGTFYKGKGAMHNMNIEAQIATEQIRAYLSV
jgi:putative flavoprotein involved in K+ transport